MVLVAPGLRLLKTMHSPIDALGSALLNACLAKYKAEKTSALANISVLISTRVGIASHSDIVNEICDLVEKVSVAEGNLAVVTAILNQKG